MKPNPVRLPDEEPQHDRKLSRDFDGEHSHDEHEKPLAESEPDPHHKPNPAALKRAGDKSAKRIAEAPDEQHHDPIVAHELHQHVDPEDDVLFPYDAQVITHQDPLRLRESSSLTARIIGRLPRGGRVRVTGKSQNHFRPVQFQAAADQPVLKGWAFTSYLSPPTHHRDGRPIRTPKVPPVTVVAEEAAPISSTETAEIATAPAGPEIAIDDKAIAGRVIDDIRRLNGAQPSLSTGLHYKDSYRYELESIGRGNAWDPRWDLGHTDSKLWKQPYELGEPMTWTLREGASASAALRQWIAGLTVADCSAAMVAIELDAVRAAVGDQVFDRCFGSSAGPGRVQQLTLSQRLSVTPLYSLLRYTDGATHADKNSGALGKRPVQLGEWYYFSNVADYVRKHPGGAWRGENALYIGEDGGKQMWSGLGATYDEEGMLRALVERYNAPRDAHDFAWLEETYTVRENWPLEYRDGFAAVDPRKTPVLNDGKRDHIELDNILAAQKKAPAAGDKTRRPGLQLETGMTLSTAKLTELVRQYGAEDPAHGKNT